MTLKELAELETDVLTCAQVAAVLGVNADSLRAQAWEAPELLGFPVIIVGSRIKIPRRAFVNFMGGAA